MTDNESIKLLEACVKLEDCEKCPRHAECEFFYDREYVGIPDVLIFSLDLINRQKAEIERLQKETERFADIGKMYSEIKSEARKEFAEKLVAIYENDKTYDRPNAHTLVMTLFRNIDNLVKEMERNNNA